MGQGHDRGTQYRSGIYCTTAAQQAAAAAGVAAFQGALGAGAPAITTEVPAALLDLGTGWFYAEPYHQQPVEMLAAEHFFVGSNALALHTALRPGASSLRSAPRFN